MTIPRTDATGITARARAAARVAVPCLAAWIALALGACSTTRTVDGAQVSERAPLAGATEGDLHQRAAVRLRLAANYYQNGQIQVAVDTARKAVEIDPGSASAHAFLGILLLDLGQIESAQASFQRALAIDHDNSEIGNNYGWFLCRTGRVREALPYFEKAAADRLYATPGQALLNAGICEIESGDLEGAEKHLLRSLAADATLAGPKYRLAQLYLRAGKLDRADFYYDLLTRSGASGADTLWLGIRIAHARKDEEGMRRLADDLRARFGDSPEAESLRRGKFDE
jgi:type IV pilus assembly protein PilF